MRATIVKTEKQDDSSKCVSIPKELEKSYVIKHSAKENSEETADDLDLTIKQINETKDFRQTLVEHGNGVITMDTDSVIPSKDGAMVEHGGKSAPPKPPRQYTYDESQGQLFLGAARQTGDGACGLHMIQLQSGYLFRINYFPSKLSSFNDIVDIYSFSMNLLSFFLLSYTSMNSWRGYIIIAVCL